MKIIGRGGVPASSARPETPELDLAKQIQRLELEKAAAVAKEDFQLANDVKIKLNALKMRKEALEKLTKQKQDAIAREDFEEAKNIKEQIEELLEQDPMRPQSHAVQRQQYDDIPPNPLSTRSEKPVRKQKILPPEPEPPLEQYAAVKNIFDHGRSSPCL